MFWGSQESGAECLPRHGAASRALIQKGDWRGPAMFPSPTAREPKARTGLNTALRASNNGNREPARVASSSY